MIAELCKAITGEVKAFRDTNAIGGSVAFSVSGDTPQMVNTPAVIISIDTEKPPEHCIGGAVIYYYKFKFKVLNYFSNNQLADDNNADFLLLEYMEKLINHFSQAAWINAAMVDATSEHNFNFVLSDMRESQHQDRGGSVLCGFEVVLQTSSCSSEGALLRWSGDPPTNIFIELEGFDSGAAAQEGGGIVERT